MNKIVIGEKGGDKEGYYESVADVLARLGKIKIGWFSSKFLPTKEKLQTSFYYVTREHADEMIRCFQSQDWASIAKLPREKDGTAHQLKIRYVSSGKFVGVEIIEARAGSDGGYFNIFPAILYFDEDAEKVYKDLEMLF